MFSYTFLLSNDVTNFVNPSKEKNPSTRGTEILCSLFLLPSRLSLSVLEFHQISRLSGSRTLPPVGNSTCCASSQPAVTLPRRIFFYLLCIIKLYNVNFKIFFSYSIKNLPNCFFIRCQRILAEQHKTYSLNLSWIMRTKISHRFYSNRSR